jgi:hypothetical protein
MIWPTADEFPGRLIEGVELDEIIVSNPPLVGSSMGMTIIIVSESFSKVEIHELTLCLAQHVHTLRAELIVAVGRCRWIMGLKKSIQVRKETTLLVLNPSFRSLAGTS